jgi:SAM-dependent methyltransferase
MGYSDVYSRAEFYDIAFDFRDVPAECDVILGLAQRYSGGPPGSFIELAAGPAAHAREMATRGLRSMAVDVTPAMVRLGRQLADEASIDIEYLEADMTSFAIDEPVDVAAILMDSLGVLLDNDAVLSHLNCVADALVPGGIYVLEMSHPRSAFGIKASTQNTWTTDRDGTTVHIAWGKDTDEFDPITQVDEVTVTMQWDGPNSSGEVKEILQDQRIVPNQLRALVTASQRFEIVAELGSFDSNLPVTNEKKSWRFIPVLRRLS